MTDCYTLFRMYHLAGIEMRFHRGDDWWRNGQNLYLDNLEQLVVGGVTSGHAAAMCCLVHGATRKLAHPGGNAELLRHCPETA